MKTYFNGFRCFRCGTEQSADFGGSVCPACGGNLEVRYAWPKNAERRWWVDEERKDIFRYRALLPVSRMELASPLRVGMTPLYEATRLGAMVGLKKLMLKDDGQNPSASFKDRAGAVALVRARETGATVLCGASQPASASPIGTPPEDPPRSETVSMSRLPSVG